MAKRRTRKKEAPEGKPKAIPVGFVDVRVQFLVLVVLGFVLYANSFTNGYALDDGIVIQKNQYVQEGIRGLPRIFASDVYQSFYAQMGVEQQLSGGRYRPLSVATFALEQELFGSKATPRPENDIAFVRHFVNVCLYILSCVLLLQFLRKYVLTNSPHAAFLACLIFLCHPLHTEVVANVKSRDEILSFLFIVLTFTAACRYRETGKRSQLVSGLLFYFLALLSKEYAITLLALIPLFFFVVRKETWGKSIKAVLPFLAVALLYLVLRVSIVGVGSTQETTEVLNAPYLFASSAEKWATKIEILVRYLKLLFVPYPLSSDYSYAAIPYTNFGDAKVWFSIVLHLSLIAATIILFVRRSVWAFALGFYLIHLLLVSNLLLDIGATMGERLVYHSSLGFALAIALLVDWAIQKSGQGRRKTATVIALSVLLIVPCGAIVLPRNAQWKNDAALFITDAQTVPNSALVNGNAAKAYLDLSDRPENKGEAKELTSKSIPFSQKAIAIHKGYLNGYLNLGVAYCKLQDFEKAEEYWNIAQQIYPDHPYVTANFRVLGSVYDDKAKRLGSENTAEAIRLLEKAVRMDPGNPNFWYDLGEACFRMGDVARARTAWVKTLQLKPDHEEAGRGLAALPAQ